MQCTHADLALQDEDMEEYDDDEEAEEIDDDDMGDDEEEEDEEEEEEEDEEEETDGRPFINPYHDTCEEEEEDEDEEDDDEEEEGAEGLFGVDDDALEVKLTPGATWNQFQGMLGSEPSANRATHMELAGKFAVYHC